MKDYSTVIIETRKTTENDKGINFLYRGKRVLTKYATINLWRFLKPDEKMVNSKIEATMNGGPGFQNNNTEYTNESKGTRIEGKMSSRGG